MRHNTIQMAVFLGVFSLVVTLLPMESRLTMYALATILAAAAAGSLKLLVATRQGMEKSAQAKRHCRVLAALPLTGAALFAAGAIFLQPSLPYTVAAIGALAVSAVIFATGERRT